MTRSPRISTFTPKVAGEILRRIADGESLVSICGPDRKKGMPERRVVYNWLARYDNFKRAYLMARRAQGELFYDQVIAIADGKDPDGQEPRDIRRDRLRVETRRWISELAPRMFADRAEVLADAVDDEDAGGHKEVVLAAKIAAIFEAARRRAGSDEK